MADLYPMTMGFPSDEGNVVITVTPQGWTFHAGLRSTFDALPVAKRLELRRAFEAQVALAKRDEDLKGAA